MEIGSAGTIADCARGALHGPSLFDSNKPIQRGTLQYRYTSVPIEAAFKSDILQIFNIAYCLEVICDARGMEQE